MNRFLMILIVFVVGYAAIQYVGGSATSHSDLPSLDQAGFLETIDGPGIVVVKFGAEWCGPCRAIEAELAQVNFSEGGVQIAMVDTDDQPELARSYNVTSIPKLVLFKDGQPTDEKLGFATADELRVWIQGHRPAVIHENPYATMPPAE